MSGVVRSFRDLIVWQKSMQLIDQVDLVVDCFTSYQRWWLGMQMHRAALSIASNISEGHDADYQGMYFRRLADARGSTRELETHLLVATPRIRAGTRPPR